MLNQGVSIQIFSAFFNNTFTGRQCAGFQGTGISQGDCMERPLHEIIPVCWLSREKTSLITLEGPEKNRSPEEASKRERRILSVKRGKQVPCKRAKKPERHEIRSILQRRWIMRTAFYKAVRILRPGQ